jgi:hypothetical protein
MVGRILLDSVSPVTQSIEAVIELLNCLGRPTDPLPEIVDLGKVKLVRSNKGDVFYCVTAKGCSCPGAIYRPGSSCKHQRKYFPGLKKSQAQIEAESNARMDGRPKAKWVGEFNGPVDSETIQARSASILASVIDLFDTTPGEVAYLIAFVPIFLLFWISYQLIFDETLLKGAYYVFYGIKLLPMLVAILVIIFAIMSTVNLISFLRNK